VNNDEPEQPGGGCAKGGGESVGRDGGENGETATAGQRLTARRFVYKRRLGFARGCRCR